jgi:protein TonB
MRRDLIIGVLVALVIHGGVAWLGEVFRHGPKKVVKEPEPTIQLIEMPKLEPEEPPEQVETEETPQQIDFAPPMQTDVPQIVQLDSFVQQVQPPPPEGLKPVGNLINIPQGRPTGIGNVQIFDPSMLDQQVQVRFRAPVRYPYEMNRAGISGSVELEFIVDANGDVKNPSVIKSTNREFEAPAIESILKWKFRPGRKSGHAVASRVRQEIAFNLSSD